MYRRSSERKTAEYFQICCPVEHGLYFQGRCDVVSQQPRLWRKDIPQPRMARWHDGTIVFQSVPELRALWALERFTFERESTATFMASRG